MNWRTRSFLRKLARKAIDCEIVLLYGSQHRDERWHEGPGYFLTVKGILERNGLIQESKPQHAKESLERWR